jgi:hypothetical protein
MMNKGKKKMKKNKETKFKVKGPEAIEDGLMNMGRAIEEGGPWVHPEMERIVLQWPPKTYPRPSRGAAPQLMGWSLTRRLSRESRTVEERGMVEWRGADIRITSDFKTDFNEANYFDNDLTVRTRHAGPATWFVFQMRDLFDGWLDAGNKYGFYELLAKAALEHLATNQPEPEDAKPLLRAMLTRAFLMLEVAKEHHVWPDDAMMVAHSQDEEGNQFRKNLEGPSFE